MDAFSDRSTPASNSRSSTVRWVREWVPQDVVGTGRKCYLLKWVTEDMLKALRERSKEAELEEQKADPATEMLFLCTYDGCGKTFAEAGALRKHTHIHGERQYVCPVEGCGKKFLDSSKLKRHNLIHTGERRYKCPYEGCGKAFSLDFNLRAHTKTHSLENYHVCPYPECGKRYTHECKLRTHIKSQHEKTVDNTIAQPEKSSCTPKPPALGSSASTDRPYVCPYAGCDKAYIHEYKLNLHLRKEHPGHNPAENYKHAPAVEHHGTDDQAATRSVKSCVSKNPKRGRDIPSQKSRSTKIAKQIDFDAQIDNGKRCPSKELADEDSEETEEDKDYPDRDDWRYENSDDDDETEDEDGNMWSKMI